MGSPEWPFVSQQVSFLINGAAVLLAQDRPIVFPSTAFQIVDTMMHSEVNAACRLFMHAVAVVDCMWTRPGVGYERKRIF